MDDYYSYIGLFNSHFWEVMAWHTYLISLDWNRTGKFGDNQINPVTTCL